MNIELEMIDLEDALAQMDGARRAFTDTQNPEHLDTIRGRTLTVVDAARRAVTSYRTEQAAERRAHPDYNDLDGSRLNYNLR